jgi:glutamine synthetase
MTHNLEEAGIEIEVQHHEVGTAGQAEIDMKYDTLLRTADKVTLYKYIVTNPPSAYRPFSSNRPLTSC